MTNAWVAGESPEHSNHDRRETRWLTPPSLVEALGSFDLDPCGAPNHALATSTYLLENGQDGLVLPWNGRVWLNPPYGRQADPFLERMVEHKNGTALIFARTETEAFFRYVWKEATAVCFLRRRIKFLRADGVKAKANSGAPSCLVAYSDHDEWMLRLSNLGQVVARWDRTVIA